MRLRRTADLLLGRAIQAPQVLWGLALACLLAAAGLAFLARFAPSTEAYTAKASGTVADVRVKTDTDEEGERSTIYLPFVRFEDGDHVAHTAPSVVTSSEPVHRVGERVEVLFDPWHPDDGCVIVGEEHVPGLNALVLRRMAVGCLALAAFGTMLALGRHWE